MSRQSASQKWADSAKARRTMFGFAADDPEQGRRFGRVVRKHERRRWHFWSKKSDPVTGAAQIISV
ncbi:hypothetical protein [uncultured Rhodoblastus sp.]|uniref:hypothetical protein n=1 Tax=uncultured Rhodoblastus sp. TaxID=543037 RepID=UPI0025E3081C|nr:hypothetical protein [uncultured Rhodoblastus sp.]